MGVVVGLLLGAGRRLRLVVVLGASRREPPRRGPTGWHARTQDTLVQAGVAGVTPGGLVGDERGRRAGRPARGPGADADPVDRAVLRRVRGDWRRGRSCGAGPAAAARGCGSCGPRSSTTWARASAPGWRCPRPSRRSGSAARSSCGAAFTAFAEDYRATGRFGECLDALKARLADPVADRIVEALRLTRDVGGTDLGRLLRTLSTFLREDVRTRGELEARQSWTVYAARLAVAAPWIVLALLSTRPEAAAAYDTPAGFAVLVVGGACTVVAYLAHAAHRAAPRRPAGAAVSPGAAGRARRPARRARAAARRARGCGPGGSSLDQRLAPVPAAAGHRVRAAAGAQRARTVRDGRAAGRPGDDRRRPAGDAARLADRRAAPPARAAPAGPRPSSSSAPGRWSGASSALAAGLALALVLAATARRRRARPRGAGRRLRADRRARRGTGR